VSARALRIGVLLPTRQCEGLEASPLERALELAERAEALGLDSAWAGESVLARPRHDPYTVLAAVAARTRRIALGTSVALPALHAPLLFAYRVAALNELARGRLVIGAGIGIDNPATRAEFAGAGAPFERRVGRMLASVRAARERIEHAPPFWVGATLAREAALERAGRVFDGWIPTAPSAEAYAAGWKSVRAAATAAGRDPDALTPAVYLTVSLADDAGAAEAALRAYVEPYYGIAYDVMRRVQGMCAGTPEQCAEWLAGYARAGVRHFVLRSPDLAGQLDALAGDVAPRLRASLERSGS
jgi:alkanesulfonate monooxygenase SsuD/methylene tetrahydromethanopterin reductase-like flavin-dependent oxidoreductase (luciferase family)